MNMTYRSSKATLFHYTVIGNNRYSVFVQFIVMEIMTVTHATNDTVMIYHYLIVNNHDGKTTS